jgi:GMP reductase
MELLNTHSIYYKDVNLIAQPNNLIKSRKQIPVELNRVFVAPMSAIVGETFAETALELGLQVILPRFNTVEEQGRVYYKILNSEFSSRLWCAIGLGEEDRFRSLFQRGCRNFVIDIANGYLGAAVEYADYLKQFLQYYSKSRLMTANIHSANGVELYRGLPSKGLGPQIYLRSGIANGSGCNTKLMTAVNRGQITEIHECVEAIRSDPLSLVEDGGIEFPCDAVKAFGAGAPYIMLGGYFRHAAEAQNIINREYKFWGSASKYQQQKNGTVLRHSEGKVSDVDKKSIKPLKELVEDLWGGISSGVSYAGYGTLTDFIGQGIFELKCR